MSLYEIGTISVSDTYDFYPPKVTTSWSADTHSELLQVLAARRREPGIGPALLGTGLFLGTVAVIANALSERPKRRGRY